MSELRYPNETREYRDARDALLEAVRGQVFHLWATETTGNHVDTVWPCWNLMDFAPEGRPDIPVPPQTFRSEFLETHYLT